MRKKVGPQPCVDPITCEIIPYRFEGYNDQDYLSVAEAADFSGISKKILRRMAVRNQLSNFKICGMQRIPARELLVYMQPSVCRINTGYAEYQATYNEKPSPG